MLCHVRIGYEFFGGDLHGGGDCCVGFVGSYQFLSVQCVSQGAYPPW